MSLDGGREEAFHKTVNGRMEQVFQRTLDGESRYSIGHWMEGGSIP